MKSGTPSATNRMVLSTMHNEDIVVRYSRTSVTELMVTALIEDYTGTKVSYMCTLDNGDMSCNIGDIRIDIAALGKGDYMLVSSVSNTILPRPVTLEIRPSARHTRLSWMLLGVGIGLLVNSFILVML